MFSVGIATSVLYYSTTNYFSVSGNTLVNSLLKPSVNSKLQASTSVYMPKFESSNLFTHNSKLVLGVYDLKKASDIVKYSGTIGSYLSNSYTPQDFNASLLNSLITTNNYNTVGTNNQLSALNDNFRLLSVSGLDLTNTDYMSLTPGLLNNSVPGNLAIGSKVASISAANDLAKQDR